MDKLWSFIKEFSDPNPSEAQSNERLWYGITASVVIIAFWMHRYGLFSNIMPIIITVALAIVFWRGERGIYPYNGQHCVGSVGAFLLTMIVFVGIGIALLNAESAKWYPTPSPYWVIIPYTAFTLLSALRGWHIDWARSQ